MLKFSISKALTICKPIMTPGMILSVQVSQFYHMYSRVRQIFFTKLVPGQVACKSHLPRRMRWLSHVTDGTSAAEIILHHLVVINKDI